MEIDETLTFRNFANNALSDSNLQIEHEMRLVCANGSNSRALQGLYAKVAQVFRDFAQRSQHRKIDTGDASFARLLVYIDALYDSRELYVYIYDAVFAKHMRAVMNPQHPWDATPSEAQFLMFQEKLVALLKTMPSFDMRSDRAELDEIVREIAALGRR